ncbi:hypothetical protein [Merismopedia glauca]|uniref:hypothetical protein n=1 Tax=Merismopedia glauca TaxID=292586 RepID=UPI0026D987CC
MKAEVGGALLYLGEGSCELFSNWVQRSPKGDRASDRRDFDIIAAVINLGKVHQSGRCSSF